MPFRSPFRRDQLSIRGTNSGGLAHRRVTRSCVYRWDSAADPTHAVLPRGKTTHTEELFATTRGSGDEKIIDVSRVTSAMACQKHPISMALKLLTVMPRLATLPPFEKAPTA